MFTRSWSKTAGAIALAAVLYGVAVNLNEIRRYVRITRM
jgi:hypothetical protein